MSLSSFVLRRHPAGIPLQWTRFGLRRTAGGLILAALAAFAWGVPLIADADPARQDLLRVL
ncbi:MAG: hypothetical protein LDL44_09970, partial [Caenispirillum sp.]|nr:hypothetical protein [Caenispirillum sp.]